MTPFTRVIRFYSWTVWCNLICATLILAWIIISDYYYDILTVIIAINIVTIIWASAGIEKAKVNHHHGRASKLPWEK